MREAIGTLDAERNVSIAGVCAGEVGGRRGYRGHAPMLRGWVNHGRMGDWVFVARVSQFGVRLSQHGKFSILDSLTRHQTTGENYEIVTHPLATIM